MKSGDYWKERFSALEDAQHQYGLETFREVEPAFEKAQREIQSQIEVWYSRYAKNNGISMAEARRQLSASELKELRWDVNEYIKHGRENAIDGRWMKELENASAKFHINRLEALKLRTQQAYEKAFGNELDAVDRMMGKLYQNGYYHTCFEIQKGFHIGWGIGQIDERKLNKVISKPWTADGRNFSDRIWQSKTRMVNELHQQLTRTILQGKAPDAAIKHMTKFLQDKTKNAKYQAGRLVMTEQAFISSAAQRDAFSDLDVEEFQVVATLDSLTSEICQEMDLQHFPMKEYQIGVTAPPFHPNCRSVTVPYFEDDFGVVGERAARGEDGKTYYVPADMTYKEWKKSFVDGHVEDLKPVEPAKIEKPSVEKANNIATDAIVDQYSHRIDDLGVNYVPYSEFDDGMKKNLCADFTGMDARLAEPTAAQFKQLSSEYESMCHKVEVKKFDAMMGSAPASTETAMNTQQATMSFNSSIVKDYDKFMERMGSAVERNQFPVMAESEYERYVVTHEFAHTLMDFESPLKNFVNGETSHIKKARKEIKEIREAYQERIRLLTVKKNEAELKALTSFDEADWKSAQQLDDELKKVTISKYADMSADEFMAEAFTDAKIGANPSEYSKRVLDVIDKYFGKDAGKNVIKLNDSEIKAINDYISSESYIINDALRNEVPLTESQIKMTKNLDAALDKLPKYKGELKRSLYFNSKDDTIRFVRKYQSGNRITYREFLSTTKGEIYNPDGQVQIIIEDAKNGIDISSINKAEQEVLYKRGSTFNVEYVTKDNDKYYIWLKER